jgi:flagellar biosynthesis/type III secretory pathway protein FliH
VAGVNHRVIVRVGGGDGAVVIEARVHRDLQGQHALLADTVEHSCTAPGDASCSAHPDCCTAAHAASAGACGACIASKMHAELQDAPPPPSQKEVAAEAKGKTEGKTEGEAKGKTEGKAEGKTEGALMGSAITAVCLIAAQLLWNGAQRRRTQRETRSLEIGAPAQAL